MALKEHLASPAELHFEGDSLEVLSAFPSTVKQALGLHFDSFKLAESRHARRGA